MRFRDPKLRPAVAASLCLFAAGCGSGGDDGPAPTEIAALSGGGVPPGPGTMTPPVEMPISTEATLDGVWLRGCDEFERGDPSEGYEVLMLTVAGTTASQRELSYVDSACTIPASPAQFFATLSLVFPGGTTPTSFGAASHFDRRIETLLIDGVPPNAALQTVLEESGALDPVSDLVLVTESELYFGETDNDTPTVRPTTLDPRPYLRQ